MPDTATLMGLAGDVGMVKGQVREMKEGQDEIKKSVSDLDDKFTRQLQMHSERSAENFQMLDASITANRKSIQEIKDILTGQAAATIVWGQVRGAVWALAALAVGSVASVYSGAAGWLKFHIFNH